MKIKIVRNRIAVQASLILLLTVLLVSRPTSASYETALSAYKKGDYATAFREWRVLGIRGLKKAQFHLAEMYARGEGVQQDNVKAVRWYRRAALRGEPEAQVRLAQRYFLGLGIKQDLEEAAEWSKIGAKAGLPEAMYLLGVMYLTGRGVEQSNMNAYVWFARATNLGHTKAKETLPAVSGRMSFGDVYRAKMMINNKK